MPRTSSGAGSGRKIRPSNKGGGVDPVVIARAIGATAQVGKRHIVRCWRPRYRDDLDWLLEADLRVAVFVLAYVGTWGKLRGQAIVDVVLRLACDWGRGPSISQGAYVYIDGDGSRWFSRRLFAWVRVFSTKDVALGVDDGPGYMLHDMAARLTRTFYGSARLGDEFILVTRSVAEQLEVLARVVLASQAFPPHRNPFTEVTIIWRLQSEPAATQAKR